MIIIHGSIAIKEKHRAAFLELAGRAVEDSKAEEGNMDYRLFEAVDEPNTFLTLEKWIDADAIKSHQASEHFSDFMKASQELLAAPIHLDIHVVPED